MSKPPIDSASFQRVNMFGCPFKSPAFAEALQHLGLRGLNKHRTGSDSKAALHRSGAIRFGEDVMTYDYW